MDLQKDWWGNKWMKDKEEGEGRRPSIHSFNNPKGESNVNCGRMAYFDWANESKLSLSSFLHLRDPHPPSFANPLSSSSSSLFRPIAAPH
jgi:hypothetical protein